MTRKDLKSQASTSYLYDVLMDPSRCYSNPGSLISVKTTDTKNAQICFKKHSGPKTVSL